VNRQTAPASDPRVRRILWQAAWVTAAFTGVMLAAGVLARDWLEALTQWLAAEIGFFGLALLVFLGDATLLPFPPDAALVVIAHSEFAANGPLFTLLLGVISALSGSVAWLIGMHLHRVPLLRRWIARMRAEQGDLMDRYGWIAVAIGALTPIPFSGMCALAGALRMRWTPFALTCLLRIPRFLVAYGLITGADQWSRALGAGL
jgi:membrane protein YqaA with SNARE-associated domain